MARVTQCEECPFKVFHGRRFPAFRKSARVGRGAYREIPFRGPTRNVDVMGVGESPGGYELYTGRMFDGDSGEVIEQEFRELKFPASRIFFANACRCMIPKKEVSQKEINKALECCRPALELAVQTLQPRLIICFGGEALQQVLRQKGITKKRGQFFWSEEFDCWVLPTFHPAFCLRDAKNFEKFRPDLARAVQFIEDGFVHKDVTEDASYQDVESIRFLLERENLTVALDTETQGVEWLDPNSVVVSYSVSDQVGRGYNVWLAWEVERGHHDDAIVWPRKNGKKVEPVEVCVKYADNYQEKIAELRELLTRPDIKKVMANGNYDLHRFEQLGIPREAVRSYTMDVLLALHATDPDNYKNASLLDAQAALVPERPDHKTVFNSRVNKADMLAGARQDPERHTVYACADTDSTLECAQVLRRRLTNDKALARYYVHLAHPVETRLLYEIEKNGILFDLEELQTVKQEVAELLREQEQQFLELAPRKVLDMKVHQDKGLRLTRGQLIQDILYSRQGFHLKPLEKTRTGQPSTNRKVLTRMRDDLPDDHDAKELLSVFFEWGPYQKLYSTYLKGFENAVKLDGKLHTQISKTFTATGRSGSRSPNLQNVPKRNKKIKQLIRRLLKAAPGHTLVAVDYSQSELRCIGDDSQDPVFLETLQSPDGDLHVKTAELVAKIAGVDLYSLPPDEFKSYRQKAKPGNFGLAYKVSPKGFQAFARDEYGVKLTMEEAEAFHAAFYQRYRGIGGWHERRVNEAEQTGMVRTKFGSIRRLPGIHSLDFQARAEAERYAVNTPIQALSNDLMLFAGYHAQFGDNRHGIDWSRARTVLFIHDELVYEVEDDYVPEFISRIVSALEHPPTRKYFGFEMSVPLIADPETGKDLANMKEYQCN